MTKPKSIPDKPLTFHKLSGGTRNLRRDGKSPAMKVAIKSLLDAGYTRKRIIDILGIRGWAEKEFGTSRFAGGIESQPWFDAVGDSLARACMTNAGAALVQVAEKLPESSALQAATIAGIMVDKSQILRGKSPVTTVAHLHLHAVKEAAEIEAKLAELNAIETVEARIVEVGNDNGSTINVDTGEGVNIQGTDS